MDARHPERYMVISKQRAENCTVDWIDNQKVCITIWKAKYLGFLCMYKYNMPLKEQRVVLHNQVNSSKTI